MEIKKPVYWHQGLFLQPQHFQLTDLHARFRLKPFLEVGLPYFWGIGELNINEAALATRIFEVQSAHVLFKDGTYLEYPGNAVLKARSFDGVWKDPNKPLPVYFGIKKLSLSEPNVAVVRELQDGADMNIRCVTSHEAEEFRDIHSDGPLAEVKSLNYVIRILWEDELEKFTDYEIIPVAVVERHAETVRLSPRFIPPSYTLGSAPALYNLVKEIRDDVSGRAHQLEQYKSPREMQKAEFDASYMVFLLALRTLNRYTPLLHHFIESPQVHPWEVYGVLRQMVGELSSFSERCNMLGEFADGTPGLPQYNHHDLAHGLFAAQTLINQLLNEISVGPEFLVFLEPRDAYLAADLPKQFFSGRNRFYLVLRSESDPDALVDSFQTSAKLAAINELPTLVRRALPGVELSHLPVAPQGLPRRAYSFYFRVETAAESWELVEKDGSIALDWPDAPADLKAELVVLRR
ncbi:type VI secretion system baseplate subunit TssK [Chitinibacter sp. S2-10]|uniref:type VI secretion system baseplate subunit TssK n=1 Tax=Chitinibacter sp. S2-10 TaxID=3373597 RepID=UPI0039776F50